MKKVQLELDNKMRTVDELRRYQATAAKELAKAKDELNAKISELKTQLQKAQIEQKGEVSKLTTSLKSELDTERSRLAIRERECGDLQDHVATLEAERSDMDNEVVSLRAEVSNLAAQLELQKEERLASDRRAVCAGQANSEL